MKNKNLVLAFVAVTLVTFVAVFAQSSVRVAAYGLLAGSDRSVSGRSDMGSGNRRTAGQDQLTSLDETSTPPTSIVTGRMDYSTGDTVAVSGRVWGPAETITLVLHAEPELQSDQTAVVVADADGNFSTEPFVLGGGTVGCVFTVTATGQSAGVTATTQFTQLGGESTGRVVNIEENLPGDPGELPNAPLAVTPGVSPASLVAAIVGTGVSTSNITYTGNANARGTFTGGTGIIGFEDGIILSTGSATNVVGSNTLPNATTDWTLPGDAQVTALLGGLATFDASILEFDFVPNSNVISFSYTFGSEEYNEYANSNYNDGFGFFVNGTNVAKIPGTNTPVSINNVNGGNPLGTNPQNAAYYRNNTPQVVVTQLDGLTVVLTVTATVTPGVTNHIKLAIADGFDGTFDSDVFIKSGSLVAKPPTLITSANATGVYGGTTTLSATLTSNAVAVPSKPVNFKINGTTVGTATTNASGVATLTGANIVGINAGTYANAIEASFAGDALFGSSSDLSDLTVTKASTSLVASSATGFDNGTTAFTATLSRTNAPVGPLSGFTVTFTRNGTSVGSAVTNASGVATLGSVSLVGTPVGTYGTGVGASFAGNLNYNSSIDTDVLTVQSSNQPPVATNSSVTTLEDFAIGIPLQASDPNGNPLTYTILSGPTNGTLTGTGSLRNYTPALNYFGPDSLTFKVNDGSLDSNVATVSITVSPENDAPVVNSTAPTTATEDLLYTYNVTRTDPDGPGQTWSLLAANTCGGSIGAANGIFTFTPVGPTPPASCVVAIQVCDGASPSLCGTQSTTVTITAVNDPPVITSAAPTTATEDELYTYNAVRTDPDGPLQLWSLLGSNTCGGSINATSGVFTFTPAGPTPPASCVVAIQVCDGAPASLCATQTTTVTISAVNDPPVITSVAPITATEDLLYTYNAARTDPDGPGQTWSLLGSNTCGGSINPASGVFTFTPVGPTPPASCVVSIQVCDGASPSLCATQSTTVTITAVNDPPVAANISPPPFNEDAATVIILSYTDPEGDLATSCAVSGLTNVSVSTPCTCLFGVCSVGVTGSPVNYNGPASFAYTVTAAGQTSNSASASLTIIAVNDPPAGLAVSVNPIAINENSSTTLSGTFADSDLADTHAVVINWGDGSPNTTLNLLAGVFSFTAGHQYKDDDPTGTPSDIYPISVTVTDNNGGSASGSTQVGVNNVLPVVDPGQVNLSTWAPDNFGATPGVWTVQGGGATVTQTINGNPTVFYSNANFTGQFAGKIKVTTTSDDDFVGFVLGYDAGEIASGTAPSDYILVDWKKLDQVSTFPGPKGLAISRVTARTTNALHFWGHVGPVQELARGATLGNTGWVTNVEYDFAFEYDANNLRILVNGVEQFNIPAPSGNPFPAGRLGFYNYSQSDVTYSSFADDSVVGTESTAVSVSKNFTDIGTLDTHSAMINWGDGNTTPGTVTGTPGGNGIVNGSHVYGDNGTYTMTITVDDDDGGTNSDTLTATIGNEPPTAILANGGPVPFGSAGAVSFSGQSDPSSVDTSAGFRYAYDFDNNGTFDSGNGSYAGSVAAASAVVPASFLSPAGSRTIRGRIIDKDGGFSDYTTVIIVGKADTVTTITCSNATYTGAAHEPCTATVTGPGLSQSVPVTYVNNINAGTATANATYPESANYNSSSDSETFTIAKASTTTVVTFEAGPYTYRGTAFTATALTTGAGSLSVPTIVVYSGDCTNVTGANGCTATATYGESANHLGSTASNSITLLARSATATADPKTITYGDADPVFTYTPTGLLGADNLTGVTCTVAGAHSAVGTYSITCSGNTNGNYTVAYVAGTLSVNPKAATATADPKTITYGDADPAFTYTPSGLLGTDTLTGVTCGVAGAHSAAGTYVITCSGNTNGNYAVTYVAGTLTVNPKAATATADPKTITYGDADPAFTYTPTGLLGTDTLTGVTCGVAGADSAAGTYAITCSGNTNGNYTVAYVAGTLTVNAKAATATADPKTITYGDADPAFTYTTTGLVGTDTLTGVTCTVAGAHSAAGTYVITCAGNTNNNYAVTYVAGTLTVNAKAATATADPQTITYGDADPVFTYTPTGLLGTDTLTGVACGVSGAHSAAGTYVITCSGNTNNNYAVTYGAGTLTVNTKAATATADPQTITYGDADPTFTYTATGLLGTDTLAGVTCTVGGAHIAAGNYVITCSGNTNANYAVTYVAGILTVNAKAATATADPQTITYGDADPAFTYTATGLLGTDTLTSVTCTVAGPHSAAGIYPITCSGNTNNNYIVAYVAGTLTVNAKAATVTGDDKTITYGDADPAFTYTPTGLLGTEALTGVTCGVAGAHSAAGTYPITCSGNTNTNYAVTYVAGTLTVNAKAATATADPQTITYGEADPVFTYTATGLLGTDTLTGVTCVVAGTYSAAGTYVITCSGNTNGNYAVSYLAGTLTVNAKAATATADSQTITYGDADPAFTYTPTGLLGTDTLTGVTCVVAGPHSAAGTYPITCSGNTNNNYTVAYVAGTLTVNAKASTVTADDKTITYGDADPAFTYTATGLLGTDALTGVTCGVAGAHSAAGTYVITCSGNTNNNYAVAYVAGTLTVNTKAATVTADDKTITYGDADPAFTYTPTGLLGTDTLPGVTCTVAGAHSAAGTYPITCSGNSNTNYAVAYVAGTLTVNKATAAISVPDYNVVYDGNPHGLSGTATGVGTTDLSSSLSFGAPVTDVPGGVIAWTFDAGGNYNAASGSATVTITKATTTTVVTCTPESLTYTGGALTPCMVLVTGANLNLTFAPNYTPNTDVGTVTASYTYAESDNHTGSTGADTFEITRAETTTTVTCTPASLVYTGGALTPCSVTVTGANLTETPSPVYVDNIDVGTATASYTYVPDPNHTGSSDSETFEITPAPTTTVVTCTLSEVYTGSAITPCSVLVTGANLSETPAPVYTNNIDVGTATASYTYVPDANHSGSSDSKTFEITKAATTTTVVCSPTSLTYTGLALTPCAVTVTGANLSLTPAPDYANNLNVGTATASYTYPGDANHTGSDDSETFEITGAPLSVTADNKTRQYGLANPPLTGTIVGIVNGENVTASYATSATSASDVGPYAIVPTLSGATLGNYQITSNNGTLSITKAPQTITWSNPAGIVYGTPLSGTQLNATVSVIGPAANGAVSYTPAAGTVLNAGNGQVLTVNVAGTNNYFAATASVVINVAKAPSAITAVAPAFISNGGTTQLSGTLTGVAGVPLGGEPVTLSIGSGAATQSCTATTAASGLASCILTVTGQPIGPNLPVGSAFGGNSNYLGSTGASTTLVFAYAVGNGGAFVVGDRNSAVGTNVTYWGSQWANLNSLTGGAAPNSFKGFANRSSTTPASVGALWTTDPGNSSNPPASVPAYMAVIVSSSISKSGSTISGNTTKIVIVRTNPGYQPNPGHAGTGTIVGVLP